MHKVCSGNAITTMNVYTATTGIYNSKAVT